ncbi:MAG: peptidoglycan editing factor PgeF [Patescibacteria group bacterium]
MNIQSSLLQEYPEVHHGSTTGDNLKLQYKTNSAATKLIFDPALFEQKTGIPQTAKKFFIQQEHTAHIEIIDQQKVDQHTVDDTSMFMSTDGMVTNIPDMYLVMYSSDCMPVFLYDPKHKAVGIAHAGREGTRKKIITEIVSVMQEAYSSEPKEIKIFIGPSICGNCYPVSKEVAEGFADYEKDCVLTLTNPDGMGRDVLLDLHKVALTQLGTVGVNPKNIEIAQECTFEQPGRFPSYRRDGKEGRDDTIWSFISLRSL